MLLQKMYQKDRNTNLNSGVTAKTTGCCPTKSYHRFPPPPANWNNPTENILKEKGIIRAIGNQERPDLSQAHKQKMEKFKV